MIVRCRTLELWLALLLKIPLLPWLRIEKRTRTFELPNSLQGPVTNDFVNLKWCVSFPISRPNS